VAKWCFNQLRCWLKVSLALSILALTILGAVAPDAPLIVNAQVSSSSSGVGSITPSMNALLFGASSGSVRIDIPRAGIAVRIEVPRDFLRLAEGTFRRENDTSFITSNIRNDYYYYNVVDESHHWTYDWKGTNSTGNPTPSDGPCFKPNFSYYDANAPYCVEIWNYLNYPQFKQPQTGVDYCALPNQTYVFNCFSPPKFVLFHGLSSPTLAGLYNFTLFVANRTNSLGYPDFVHAWNTTLFVPVSMAYNAGFITGAVCDGGTFPLSCSGPIRGKGVVYAESVTSKGAATIVARAYVNQTLCHIGNCGLFNLTGLAPGQYLVEGSAGLNNGVAYSLTPYGYPSPQTIYVPANGSPGFTRLPLRRAPLVCGQITYENTNFAPINSLAGNSYLLAAGFRSNPAFELNVTVEATDPLGHVFRFQGVSSGTTTDSFAIATGVGVKYVGTDPYGTEFAGLPAPEDSGPYTLIVKVWVSGYVQRITQNATMTQSPGTIIPSCSPTPNQPFVSEVMRMGGVITGTLQLCNSFPSCVAESPHQAEASLPISPISDALFGGNIMIEAVDSTGFLRAVTVINGSLPNGKTNYANSSSLPFYLTGFSEYYNHSLSGVWHFSPPDSGRDYGLPDGTYTLQIYVRGYELTSVTPSSISIVGGGNATVTAYMLRGGAFEVLVGSYDNRLGSRAIQAQFPWRFLNSSIPVRARVYFSGPDCLPLLCYVERIMETRVPNGVGTFSFTVTFAGQNWSLREIWFYGLVPSHITNGTYTITANTLGYVQQNAGGVGVSNNLVGFSQVFVVLFIANEVDITAPIFLTLNLFGKTSEYDHAIGQVLSGGLYGAEMGNLSAGVTILQLQVFGFGGMHLGNTTVCQTNVLLRGLLLICGQGHFFYVGPDGTRYLDYGLDVGNYTAQLPEFGFTVHYLQVLALPVVQFTDLFLEQGVTLEPVQMANITQGPLSLVTGWTFGVPSEVAALSWAQVQAVSSSYSRTVPTTDGRYDGVGALFLPAGTYTVTFSDVQYQAQNATLSVAWGGSYPLTPSQPLCPTNVKTCPSSP
jgi:hypothetical protein